MTRCPAFLLLCFAMLAMPVHGANATVACQPGQAMTDPSLLTRHASLKSEAETRIGAPGAARAICLDGGATGAASTVMPHARERRASLEAVYPELDAHGVAFLGATAPATLYPESYPERQANPQAGSHGRHDAVRHEHRAGKHGADRHAAAQCAPAAMLMPQLSDILMAHRGQALPHTPLAALVDFEPEADPRPTTSRC